MTQQISKSELQDIFSVIISLEDQSNYKPTSGEYWAIVNLAMKSEAPQYWVEHFWRKGLLAVEAEKKKA